MKLVVFLFSFVVAAVSAQEKFDCNSIANLCDGDAKSLARDHIKLNSKHLYNSIFDSESAKIVEKIIEIKTEKLILECEIAKENAAIEKLRKELE